MAGWDPVVQLFFWGGTPGGLGVLLLIATTAVAVHRLLSPPPGRRHPLAAARSLPFSPLSRSSPCSCSRWSNFATLLGVEPTSPLRWGIPITYLIIAVLGISWALVLQPDRPDVYAAIGLGAKSATSATIPHSTNACR